MNQFTALILFIAIGLPACRAVQTHSDPKLVGGSPVPNRLFAASFFLRTNCTATKIAKNAMLTAAHCVINRQFKALRPEFEPGSGQSLRISTENRLSHNPSATDIVVRVRNTHVFPAYWQACQKNCEAKESLSILPPNPKDLAVVVVELPNSRFDAIPIARIAAGPVPGDANVMLNGYGCEKGANVPDEPMITYKYMQSTLFSVADFQSFEGPTASLKNSLWKHFFLTPGLNFDNMSPRDTASLCPGDSGGALYLKVGREYELIGINSFVISSEEDPQKISQINFHARVDRKSAPDVTTWLESLHKK